MSTTKKSYATHVTTPTGARVYLRGKTKEELDQKVLQAKIEIRAGVDITNDYTFAEYADVWMKAYKGPSRLRPCSIDTLQGQLKNHVLPFFGSMKLKDIRPMHIQLFINSISDRSRSLQMKCIGIVRGVLTSAADNGLIVRNPMRKEDKATGEAPEEEEPLTNEQAVALLDAVKDTRAYTFCLLALTTGMRRGEILGLMWEDIDFKTNVITVSHNKAIPPNAEDAPVTTLTKTEAGRRKLPIGNTLREHLLALREASISDYVVCMGDGRSLTKSAYRALWKNVSRRTVGEGRVPRELGQVYGGVKVTLDFHCHPHQLRHTYITNLFEAGLDIKQVQYLAGHATPEMTMRVYTHFREKQRFAETQDQVCVAVDYLVGSCRLQSVAM